MHNLVEWYSAKIALPMHRVVHSAKLTDFGPVTYFLFCILLRTLPCSYCLPNRCHVGASSFVEMQLQRSSNNSSQGTLMSNIVLGCLVQLFCPMGAKLIRRKDKFILDPLGLCLSVSFISRANASESTGRRTATVYGNGQQHMGRSSLMRGRVMSGIEAHIVGAISNSSHSNRSSRFAIFSPLWPACGVRKSPSNHV